MKKLNLLSALIIGCAISSSAMANGGYINNVKITQMINTAGKLYGGCMMQLTKNISTVNSSCRTNWVTLSCDGQLENSVTQASAMWNSAQMAFALDKTIRVRVSNNKINGYCHADYIRVQN